MSEHTTSDEPQKAVASDFPFAVGDAVTWTHTTSNGTSFNFSTRNGKIEEIGTSSACVKMRNGRRAWVPLSRLRKQGDRTELTEMFMGKSDPSQPHHP